MPHKIYVIICFLLLSGCSSTPYKKADLSMYAGRTGYLEKEISPQKYILEYSHIGGYDYDLNKNIGFWEKRALELCPNGYSGEHNVVHPAYAKIEEFVCPQRFCGEYPLVTGIVECN